ncbi:MAG: hypothetical protein P8Z41_06690 [Anaerolineales bacterium]
MSGKINRNVVVVVLALIVGIALGVLYAWIISPVEWVDGAVYQLRRDLRVDYLRMTIDSYALNEDTELAVERYNELGADKADILSEVANDPGTVTSGNIQRFNELVETPPEMEETGETEQTPAAAEGESSSSLSRLLLPVCGATLLLGLLLVAALVLRRRMDTGAHDEQYAYENDYEPAAEAGETDIPMSIDQPLATFRTTYSVGDDLYDDSFSIESAAGDFLGECGVGIGDVIGVGEPKKVSAFEIWLFDKNDIQTVTKVLMSRYTFEDVETRANLAAKGDPFEARSGEVISLQTASLTVEARIVDMNYGDSALPAESYFDRLTVELKAFPTAI